MDKIVLIGAGGHCKVIIDIIHSGKEYEIVGITDKTPGVSENLGIPVIGNDMILEELYKSGVRNAFVSLGSLSDLKARDKIYKSLKQLGFKLPILVHKTAIASPYSHIGEGTCIMAGAIINPGAIIGSNCIVNTGAVIEHDCRIGFNTHISPNAALAGGVTVGDNCHIGMGSSVIENISIGNNVKAGAGAVVIDDLPDNVTAVGVPAKVIKANI